MADSKAPGYRRFFANVFTIIAGDNDISIAFAYGGEGHPEGTVDEAAVIMTPRSLKVLATILDSAVKSYEQEFGEIHIPEEKLQQMRQGEIIAPPAANTQPTPDSPASP